MTFTKIVFFFALQCLYCCYCISSTNEKLQRHYDTGYMKIVKALKLNNSLAFQNITTVLRRLQLHDCSKPVQHSHQCIETESLFQLFNISKETSLTADHFAKFSSLIIYALLPFQNNEEKRGKYLSRNIDVYNEIVARYNSRGICEQVLDKLLNDIDQSIGIKYFTRKKCFSSQDILKELKITKEHDVSRKALPIINIEIISKLLNGQCIEKTKETSMLPCSSYFVKELFQKYGGNGTINKQQMDHLLQILNLGKEPSSNRNNGITEEKVGENIRHRRDAKSINDHHYYYHSDASNTAVKEEHLLHKKCFSVDELFSIYNVDENVGVTVEMFERFSVALIEQLESDVCDSSERIKRSNDKTTDFHEGLPKVSVWGFAFAAVSVVSLCSLVMIIPLIKTKFYEKSLVFLVSLAVGTLVGDALLHLLPHATGFHSHASDDYTAYKNKTYLWKFVSVLAGVYGLFFFESTARFIFRVVYSKKRGPMPSKSVRTELELKQPVVLVNKIVKREEVIEGEKVADGSNLNHDHDDERKPSIAPMAWTVIIGDTLHNIADGIAIGVAFSDSIIGGMSTSIAVLCHEVPHELGDFVVLLSAGMSVRQALFANFLSACFCFLGLILGKSIAEIEDANLWILGVTGGFFLYIALTNKLPELMHVSEESDLPKTVVYILEQAGIVLGVLGMFLLAYFKKDIDF